jgi:hypothetical protein
MVGASTGLYTGKRRAEKRTGLLLETESLIGLLARRMEAANNCQLDIVLVTEFVSDQLSKIMFPVNTLRNYALLQARTRLVAMVDVDLIVSNTLLEWLKVPAK